MSELRDAIADALRATVRREVGDTVYIDEMSESMAEVYTGRIMALIEQSRPSREEFERNVDLLLEQHESLICCYDRERPKQQRRVDERRREVMRMAGYPEER